MLLQKVSETSILSNIVSDDEALLMEWHNLLALKAHPLVAAERKKLADAYRRARRASPVHARRVMIARRSAHAAAAESVFSVGTTTGQGGLDELLK